MIARPVMRPCAARAFAIVLLAWGPAMAHVVVEPEQVPTSRPQVYSVIVPAEHEVSPTVEVTLFVPPAFDILSVEESPGWRLDLSRDLRAGGAFRLTWAGGRVSPNRYVRFGFAAQNPSVPMTVVWRAVQRYADGSVDEWDDPASEQRTASVTRVVLPATESRGGRLAVGLGVAALAIALLALAIAMVAARRRATPKPQ